MLILKDIQEKLNLEIATKGLSLDRPVRSGYASDLLSCAMAKGKKDDIWVTLQSHLNVVAVASLHGMSAVIVTEDSVIEPATIARAESENVVLLRTPRGNYNIIGELYSLGIRGED